INQIAAGEVVERPASVVKELIENAIDAGSDQIVIDVIDGGRTLISVIDNGRGMHRDDLANSIKRHANSKLPSDNLLNINFMGFRGEALPSIASVSDMTIDTNGLQLNATTGEIKPSSWESGTRIRIENLFARIPARLKFLRSDRGEMMAIVEVVKRLAMARTDIGFTLNNKWRFPKGQSLIERIVAVMGDEVKNRMLKIERENNGLKLSGWISEPTLRRASSVDQYLFVNGRPVKDRVLIGALRAAYMDVMNAREFPLCALYLDMPVSEVDVNVSPSKTEVHFLEPARIRGFIIKTIRDALAIPMTGFAAKKNIPTLMPDYQPQNVFNNNNFFLIHEQEIIQPNTNTKENEVINNQSVFLPLGQVIGQISNKYILSQNENGLVITDQHAAHERIIYEQLRTHKIKVQNLLVPIVIKLKPEEVLAVLEVASELKESGLDIAEFGEDSISINEKPADWDLDWAGLLKDIAFEVLSNGHSSQLHEKLHLKLANYACHHSVRAGQKLTLESMNALLRDVEKTERGGECNHGRPVYKIIPFTELDAWFERI
ncbi:MAG: DNA mismatch repair endonuclease MutL, partial [Alphaproteobacteria bacterium]|nr:DNA mismatch repair endonuclease MutL [Alphaproteobacteria bacterium]